MATPQSRDLARNGHTPADPQSVATSLTAGGARPGGPGRRGRVPEDNRPGHHPDHEQDKPVDAFVAKAAALAAAGRPGEEDDPATAVGAPPAGAPARPAAPADVPGQRRGRAPALGALRLDVAVPAVSLLDAARRPPGAWDEIGESRRAWLLRISLLGPLGAWRYSTEVRPRLEAAERARGLAGA